MSLATQIVHWPGQDTPACDLHAQKLRTVADIMGFTVSSTPCNPFDPELRCSNCEHEAQKIESYLHLSETKTLSESEAEDVFREKKL